MYVPEWLISALGLAWYCSIIATYIATLYWCDESWFRYLEHLRHMECLARGIDPDKILEKK